MKNIILNNIEPGRGNLLPIQDFADNRVQALKSLALLLLHELELLENLTPQKGKMLKEGVVSLSDEVQNFEVELIRSALVRAKGRQRVAARLLRTKTTTLYAKIKRYGIEPQSITVSAPEN